MTDKDAKQEEAPAAVPAVAAEGAEGGSAGAPGEETAPKEGGDGKKKDKKGSKGGKGKGGGKGKSQAPGGPFGHGGSGFRLNVKNLGADVTTEQLRALFEPCGTVSQAEVKVHDDGKSRGFGFVIFSSEEEAKKAIADMNNKDVDGKALNVSPAERRPQEEGEDGKGKGKGKGKDKGKGKGKQGAEAWNAQMQMQYDAALYQQQMLAMQQWYAYIGAMGPGAAPAAASAGASAPAPPVNPEYEGSLKSISSRNGYGFIVCAATMARYERDVYVDKEVLPEGVQPPDRVIFTVTLNAKGHPKAATCKLAV